MMDFKELLGKGLNRKKMLVEECVQMMEKYLDCFSQEKGEVSFSAGDMKRWKEEFFPELIKTGEIPGYQFFNEGNKEGGVGCDGTFTGYQYFQTMYRLYRKLYELSAVS